MCVGMKIGLVDSDRSWLGPEKAQVGVARAGAGLYGSSARTHGP